MIALILMLIDFGYVSARCIAISIIHLIESLRYNVIIVTSSFTAYSLDRVKIVCGIKNTNAQIVCGVKNTNAQIVCGVKNTNAQIFCGVKNTNAQNVAAIAMILCNLLLCSC